MKIRRTPHLRVMLFLLGASSLAMAQTATSGLVSGTVTDPSGASVPSAAVELSDADIGAVLRTVGNASGQYVFPSVPSGTYQLKVTAPGFRTYLVGGLKVEVTKSNTQNVPLELGATTETVSVSAGVTAEMQMVDATIGNVIALQQLKAFPSFTRTVNELLTLQPGATPSGEVTGARNDQSTFLLDGMDVTNNSIGGLGTFMYLGVESVEEFRVEVANPNASFGRGAGGQVALVGRHGTNAFHGSGFWYHQNDNLNANNWTNNRIKVRKPELKDNRYGFVAAGPIIPNKTFFFVNHDGRRFPRSGTVTRIVPTATMRQGILQFRDAAGNVNQYPLATSQACGPNGTDACDPRGLGLSPSIAALWRQLPEGNDPASGDGLNTLGFTSTVGFPNRYDFYHARLDHQLTQKWRLDASIRYYRQVDASNLALDIRGGNVASTRSSPTRQNMETVGISGTITPSLTADFRFGRVRHRTALDVLRPNASAGILNIPGTSTPDGPIALDIGARGGAQSILSEPFDVDTQLSRKQQNDNRIYQLNADLNWIKSKHSLQFGAHMRWLPTLHRRDDKVLGALGSLVAQIDSDLGTLVLPNSIAPPSCGAGRTAGCLQTADLQTWNRMFAGVTGLVDNISVLAVRDGSFKPLPFGDLLESDTTGIKAPEFYLQDTWRIKPSLTITLGLNYGWQTPPVERKGRYTLQLDKASGQILTPVPFFEGRRQGMLSGQINNPNFAFLPVNDAQRGVFDIDWMNLGPRASVAWNPDFKGGPLGKLLGGKTTVFRGGYALIYDRLNTVSSVIVPSLGIGFGQTLNITVPGCNATGAGGAGCNATSTNPALRGFRVGVDGTIPRPVVPAQSIPASPPWGNLSGTVGGALTLFPEILSFQIDPSLKQGKHHSLDFSIQRELKGNMILEVAYVARLARNLQQSVNFLQSPYAQLDRASGQTFAQAFDNVALALRAGGTAANQPWFENNVPGGTAAMVAAGRANFINGNVSSLFLTLDQRRMSANLQPFNNYMSQMMLMKTANGLSNYNALLTTLRKRFSKGYRFDANYTLSKSLDQLGQVQNSANVAPNSFDQNVEYGPSAFDITHIFNGLVLYELPFKSRLPVLKQILGGWTVSGIFTARSGDPLVVVQGGQVWGGGLFLAASSGAIPTVNPSTLGNSVSRGVAGANNIGTNSNAATGGSGLNMFSNPDTVFNGFRRVEISRDGRAGRSNPLRGMPRWNLDTSIGKTTTLNPGEHPVSLRISFDFFNVFNKVDFNNPNLDLNNSRAFGVITTQLTPGNRIDGSRWIQMGVRIEF